MIDDQDREQFVLEEDGHRVWAEYRIRDGRYLIPHVEAEPALRGTGAAGRLMQQIVDHARAENLVIVPRCSYATAWFERHPEAEDVLG